MLNHIQRIGTNKHIHEAIRKLVIGVSTKYSIKLITQVKLGQMYRSLPANKPPLSKRFPPSPTPKVLTLVGLTRLNVY